MRQKHFRLLLTMFCVAGLASMWFVARLFTVSAGRSLTEATTTPGGNVAVPTQFTNPPATPATDVIVHPQQNSSATKVRVGQIIAVTRPEDFDEWQVDYNVAALAALTPPDKMRAPGLQGWLFRALKPGETQIVLISVLPMCQKDQPCPNLSPDRFVITLQIEP